MQIFKLRWSLIVSCRHAPAGHTAYGFPFIKKFHFFGMLSLTTLDNGMKTFGPDLTANGFLLCAVSFKLFLIRRAISLASDCVYVSLLFMGLSDWQH